MIKLSRLALSSIAILFGLYHAVLGLGSLANYQNQSLALLAILIYLGALFIVVLFEPALELPNWVGFVNLLVAIIVTWVMVEIINFKPDASYDTWYVGGLGTVLAIGAIRRQRASAILGMLWVTALTLIYGGPALLFTAGIIGSWLWIIVGYGSSRALESSRRAAQDYFNRSIETRRLSEIAEVYKVERQARIDATLQQAGPMLTKIQRSKGLLSESEKTKARLLEAQLRDEIRGRNLVTPELVEAVRKLRKKGVEVQLLDDGGFDAISDKERKKLISKIVKAIANVRAGKLIIRTVPSEAWRVSVVALRKDSDSPDLFERF